MVFTINGDSTVILQAVGQVDADLSSLANIPEVITTVRGTGSNTITTYEIPASIRFAVLGTLTHDTDREILIINYAPTSQTASSSFILRGTYNLGMKPNGEASVGVGIIFPNQPVPWWNGALNNQTGTCFVVATSSAVFNFVGGIIQGTFGVSFVEGATGTINGGTFNILDNGLPTGQEWLSRFYSPAMLINNLNMVGGSLSFGEGNLGTFSINRFNSGVGYWMQQLTGTITLRNIAVSGNIVDIAIYAESGSNDMTFPTTLVVNSQSGTKLDIRGGEVASNVLINNAGYLVHCKEVQISAMDPLGNNLAGVATIIDNDNGQRKNLNGRNDISTTTYTIGYADGAITTWNVAGGFAPTTFTSLTNQRIVTGVINVVRSSTNTRGTSNTGPYTVDLKGNTNILGEDLFTVHYWNYGYLYFQTTPSFNGLNAIVINPNLIKDDFITELDLTQVALYTGITIFHNLSIIQITEDHTLDEIYDFIMFNKTLNTTSPTISTSCASGFGNTLTITYAIQILGTSVISAGTTFTTLVSTRTITIVGTTASITATYFDSTFDTIGTIIPPTSPEEYTYDTFSVHSNDDDANSNVNPTFTRGQIVRFNIATYRNQLLWIRIASSQRPGVELVAPQRVGLNAGSQNFDVLAIGESPQLRVILELIRNINDNTRRLTFDTAGSVQSNAVTGNFQGFTTLERTRIISQINELSEQREELKESLGTIPWSGLILNPASSPVFDSVVILNGGDLLQVNFNNSTLFNGPILNFDNTDIELSNLAITRRKFLIFKIRFRNASSQSQRDRLQCRIVLELINGSNVVFTIRDTIELFLTDDFSLRDFDMGFYSSLNVTNVRLTMSVESSSNDKVILEVELLRIQEEVLKTIPDLIQEVKDFITQEEITSASILRNLQRNTEQLIETHHRRELHNFSWNNHIVNPSEIPNNLFESVTTLEGGQLLQILFNSSTIDDGILIDLENLSLNLSNLSIARRKFLVFEVKYAHERPLATITPLEFRARIVLINGSNIVHTLDQLFQLDEINTFFLRTIDLGFLSVFQVTTVSIRFALDNSNIQGPTVNRVILDVKTLKLEEEEPRKIQNAFDEIESELGDDSNISIGN